MPEIETFESFTMAISLIFCGYAEESAIDAAGAYRVHVFCLHRTPQRLQGEVEIERTKPQDHLRCVPCIV